MQKYDQNMDCKEKCLCLWIYGIILHYFLYIALAAQAARAG